MIQLRIPSPSNIDEWLRYLKSLTYVKDAEWIDRLLNPYTLITFESEAHKNWFILRWS